MVLLSAGMENKSDEEKFTVLLGIGVGVGVGVGLGVGMNIEFGSSTEK